MRRTCRLLLMLSLFLLVFGSLNATPEPPTDIKDPGNSIRYVEFRIAGDDEEGPIDLPVPKPPPVYTPYGDFQNDVIFAQDALNLTPGAIPGTRSTGSTKIEDVEKSLKKLIKRLDD